MNITIHVSGLAERDVATAVLNRLPLSDLAELREIGLTEAELDIPVNHAHPDVSRIRIRTIAEFRPDSRLVD